jgi:hypothetical protein
LLGKAELPLEAAPLYTFIKRGCPPLVLLAQSNEQGGCLFTPDSLRESFPRYPFAGPDQSAHPNELGDVVLGVDADNPLANLDDIGAALPVTLPRLDQIDCTHLPLEHDAQTAPMAYAFSPDGRELIAVGASARVWRWFR